jgi:Holliday junction resolvase RusA-like endonuclease
VKNEKKKQSPLLTLTVPLTPVPASRPRVTRWSTYYGKRYTEWRKQSERIVLDAPFPPIAEPISAIVTFAIPRSKTGKLMTPVGDGDNYEKAIYDLLQSKGYIEDDRWIVSATWRKRFVPYLHLGYSVVTLFKEHEEIEICHQ